MRTKVLSLTPRSNSYGVEWQSPESSNLGSRCMVTGEPFHDVISLRRAVATSAPDCRDLIFDHMDLIGRLSEPLAPCTSVVSKAQDVLIELTPAAERLLKTAVGRLASDFEARVKLDQRAAALLKRFMQHSRVGCAPVWKRLFGAFPPRGNFKSHCSQMWSNSGFQVWHV